MIVESAKVCRNRIKDNPNNSVPAVSSPSAMGMPSSGPMSDLENSPLSLGQI